MPQLVHCGLHVVIALALSSPPILHAQAPFFATAGADTVLAPAASRRLDSPASRPITESAVAMVAARSAEWQQQPTPKPRRACGRKVALGAALGAGVGAGYVVVAASGGTESAATMMKAFAALGLVVGGLAGAVWCAL